MVIKAWRGQGGSFLHVLNSPDPDLPFKVVVPISDGKKKRKTLGRFRTAAEAALWYARHLGPDGCAAALTPKRPKEPVEAPMTEAEAIGPPPEPSRLLSDLEAPAAVDWPRCREVLQRAGPS